MLAVPGLVCLGLVALSALSNLTQRDQRRQEHGLDASLVDYTGLAQAAVLDRLRPGWQPAALAEGGWLETLLRAAQAPD